MEISDRKKGVSEGKLRERRYRTERSILGEKCDRKKANSDRKKRTILKET